MKSNRVMSLAVLWMGIANLILITTNPVDRILSFTCAFWGIVFFVIAEVMYVKERRNRKASVYADWERSNEEPIMIDEPQQPIGAYGKSFHSLNIRELLVKPKKCPRCARPLWRKEGLGYLSKSGDVVQLWKCLGCKYEEERFVL